MPRSCSAKAEASRSTTPTRSAARPPTSRPQSIAARRRCARSMRRRRKSASVDSDQQHGRRRARGATAVFSPRAAEPRPRSRAHQLPQPRVSDPGSSPASLSRGRRARAVALRRARFASEYTNDTLALGGHTWRLSGHALTRDGAPAADIAIGVIGDAGGAAPATLAAIGRLRGKLDAAKVDVVVVLGGSARPAPTSRRPSAPSRPTRHGRWSRCPAISSPPWPTPTQSPRCARAARRSSTLASHAGSSSVVRRSRPSQE